MPRPKWQLSLVLVTLWVATATACIGGDASETIQTPATATAPVMPSTTAPSPTTGVPASSTPAQPASPTATELNTPTTEPAADATFSIERVFEWIELSSPTFLAEVPDGTGRLAVLEQSGLIVAFDGDQNSEQAEPAIFLDIRGRVNRGGNEEGLLGLVFHPDHDQNGRLFIYYSADDPHRSVISEFRTQPGGNADHSTERVILEIGQPYSNHNGGMLAFGPDGYLYIAVGDGGSGGDPHGNGQNPTTLLGSILRIDVDSGEPYAVPPSNPFAEGAGGAPEVWAYGLRNPWRFAFAPSDGALWVADVGQNRFEEVSVVEKGGNYGWNTMEGPWCYQVSSCDRDDLKLPVAWYDHDEGCSITGGYVNRDPATPALNGSFVFADYCSGTVWRADEGSPDGLSELVDTNLNISSFGESLDGTLYLVSAGGNPGIFRLVQGD